jgi:predicted GNAT superfamily acetyltransferase
MTGSVPSSSLPPIRDLVTPEEFRACVQLQELTWGTGFSEKVPAAILGIAARMGGVVAGAVLPDGTLAGFVFGLTGLEDGIPTHWSDMLAVHPAHRGQGLGWALKMHQRDRLLALGVTGVRWTFDPLEAPNAHLNLARLGGVAREYVENMYGDSDSPLHRGIGTDRLIVRWELDSPRVRARLEGRDPGGAPGEAGPPVSVLKVQEEVGPEGEPVEVPGPARLDLEDPVLTLPIPRNLQGLKARAPDLALLWRERTRLLLRHYLDRGWEVREFDRSPPVPRYLLVRRDRFHAHRPR